jgi:hypothetical protein
MNMDKNQAWIEFQLLLLENGAQIVINADDAED